MRYVLGMLAKWYKYPVVSREEGCTITPLIRLVPVRGCEAEAKALMERMQITVKEE